MAADNNDIAEHIFLDILNEVEPMLSQEYCCIYNVPELLRKENNDAYTPHLISIGPIHHGNVKLKPMEKQKCLYFRDFRQRLSNDGLQDLKDYTNRLGNNDSIEKIRNHYSEKYTNFKKKSFVRMMLLDAVFIMELFLRKLLNEETIDDYLFEKSMINKSIQRDLLLLENQIPFFILDELFQLVPDARRQIHSSLLLKRERSCSSFLELARCFFQTYDPYPDMTVGDINMPTSKKKLKQGWDEPKHFTDLIRYFFIPEDLVYNIEPTSVTKTATKLKRVGITFEPVSDRCLLGVKFLKLPILYWLGFLVFGLKWFKARLQIPKLKVDGSTESVLRNLMAFEQCHYPKHHYVCSYVALIGDLVHTEKDVDLLVERKVIVHELGSDKDLAGMINVLCKNIVSNATYYATLSRRLNEHYYSHFNRTLTHLGLVYFPDLWILMVPTIVIFLVILSWATTIDEALADLLFKR